MKIIGCIALSALSALFLGGCATLSNGSSKAVNCQTLDWHQLGVQAGKNGSYPYEITRVQKRCPAITIDQATRAAWEAGRTEGLKQYCTKAIAYELGQRGHALNQVCPEDGLLELQQSHALGFSQYYQRIKLQQMFYHQQYIPQAWYDAYHPWY